MKKIIGVLLLAIFLSFPVPATGGTVLTNVRNIKIPAGQSVYWQFKLNKGDRLIISVGANGGINLFIRDAMGRTWWFIKDRPYGKLIFVAPNPGIYQVFLDNSHSFITDKLANAFIYYISSAEINQFTQELVLEIQRYLEEVRKLNPKLNLPSVMYQVCNQPNAFYNPVTNTIIICSEIIWKIANYEMLEDLNNWKARTIDAVAFIFFHELGHALIRLCNLPVLGKEENAADSLATLAAVELNPEMAYEGAILFLKILNTGEPIFWDSHSPSPERFYNILCWLYGSDPKTFFLIKREFPELQSRNCEYEYLQLDESWTKLLKSCGFNFD